jgi:hypothetical protein
MEPKAHIMATTSQSTLTKCHVRSTRTPQHPLDLRSSLSEQPTDPSERPLEGRDDSNNQILCEASKDPETANCIDETYRHLTPMLAIPPSDPYARDRADATSTPT